jgi:nucleotide-binding universal stress UspA family protein
MYTSVLVPLDGTETSARAVPRALAIARELAVPLILLRVVSNRAASSPSLARDQQASMAQAEAYLASLKRSMHARGVEIECLVRLSDDPVATMDETVEALGKALIVREKSVEGPDSYPVPV